MKLMASVIVAAVFVAGTAPTGRSVSPSETRLANPTRQPASADSTRLPGTYRLLSFVRYDRRGGTTGTDFTVGVLTYDPAGRVSVQVMTQTRDEFAANRTNQDKAGLFSTYNAYFGRWELNASSGGLVHHIEGALNQSLVGTVQQRAFEFSSDGRILQLHALSGGARSVTTTWERYE